MFSFVPLQEHHWPRIPVEARPQLTAQTKGIVALNEQGDLEGACCFDTWTFNSCQLHIYIKNPFVLKHGVAYEVFNYAFNTCGKSMVIGMTPADNEKALKFIKNIGLNEIFRIPEGYAVGVDYVVTQLKREDCRWISHEEKVTTHG